MNHAMWTQTCPISPPKLVQSASKSHVWHAESYCAAAWMGTAEADCGPGTVNSEPLASITQLSWRPSETEITDSPHPVPFPIQWWREEGLAPSVHTGQGNEQGQGCARMPPALSAFLISALCLHRNTNAHRWPHKICSGLQWILLWNM